MKLLAIDTATDACSAAVHDDGRVIERYQVAPRDHTRLILPMIDAVLAESGVEVSELDALAFGCGPGSFTGVRIATGVAQGIGFARSLPLVPVSDLAALAQQAARVHGAQRVLSSLDARMGELYWALYQVGADGLVVLAGDERLTVPAVMNAAGVFGAGPGWAAYPELHERIRPQGVDAAMLPRAQDIVTLALHAARRGATVTAAQAIPTYLRDEVAWK